jgi:hypothetical protein
MFNDEVQLKAIPLQDWTGPYGSRTLRLPEFPDNRHMMVARCQPYAPAAFTHRRLKGEVHGNNPHTEADPKHSIQNAVLAFH